MARLARLGELELTRDFRISEFSYTFAMTEAQKRMKAEPVMLGIEFAIFLFILGPFCCFKIYIDDTYEIRSKRDKRRQEMLIRQDEKNRAKLSRDKAFAGGGKTVGAAPMMANGVR